LDHLIEGGVVPSEVLLEPVRRRRFSLVILPRREGSWGLFTDDIGKAVEENYTFEYETAAGLFYSPGRPNGT
jgi:hypothetical protein